MNAFNGDTFIAKKIALLARFHRVKTIIETGTYEGSTTEHLASLAANVISVELDQQRARIQKRRLAHLSNIQIIEGNSPEVLNNILPSVEGPVLFYLDAHWNEYCPLLDELTAIGTARLKDLVIAIHDFLVPGTSLGFDIYNSQPFTLEWITPALNHIYGEGGWRHTYNTEEASAGYRRGIIYVEPKRA